MIQNVLTIMNFYLPKKRVKKLQFIIIIIIVSLSTK